ncbi:uncharacterized protein PITG_16982 [Phytophthora infestans T30-4]|uniref:Uncharacterized protein n=1 Tax=Phytophthora infestans (strain T30-4) TaxID=403677 RepID=D0NUI9_PHYIT|nr:uncharacterized protein PITG_16982 [Phytophthora infestans T30-4]EEY65335.1 hypothetical protein PITG_16982 [Phytophthora infestans T30-4]|eukprot:XP_002897198.1 hypothetical protein PITG_16982 [Phytophthora infestans T30-4]
MSTPTNARISSLTDIVTLAIKTTGSKWAMATTVSGDGTVAVTKMDECGGSAHDYYLGPVSKEYINSNACAPIDEPPYFAKFYYVDPPSSSSPDSKSGSSDSGSSTDSAKANTTTTGDFIQTQN